MFSQRTARVDIDDGDDNDSELGVEDSDDLPLSGASSVIPFEI